MNPTGTFVPPTVIKALGDMPGNNMTPAMASAAANLWNWGLYRQRVGKRCELKAYERDSGINRDTLAGWMKRLEQAGRAERCGNVWRCIPMAKTPHPGAGDSGPQVPEPSAQDAGNSGPTKNKEVKEEKEEAPKSSRKEELMMKIVHLWNQQKPLKWKGIDDLSDPRPKNLEKLGYRGVNGLERFLEDLPLILAAVKANQWWASKDLGFDNLTRPTKTHCIEFLEAGRRMPGACATSDSLDSLSDDPQVRRRHWVWQSHGTQQVLANEPLKLSPLGEQQNWSDETKKQKHAEIWMDCFGRTFNG
jgi:hypothetical protein